MAHLTDDPVADAQSWLVLCAQLCFRGFLMLLLLGLTLGGLLMAGIGLRVLWEGLT